MKPTNLIAGLALALLSTPALAAGGICIGCIEREPGYIAHEKSMVPKAGASHEHTGCAACYVHVTDDDLAKGNLQGDGKIQLALGGPAVAGAGAGTGPRGDRYAGGAGQGAGQGVHLCGACSVPSGWAADMVGAMINGPTPPAHTPTAAPSRKDLGNGPSYGNSAGTPVGDKVNTGAGPYGNSGGKPAGSGGGGGSIGGNGPNPGGQGANAGF